ncbi:unnamed protein product [Ostreobium quekettii]|uniref:DUF1279 domain-containing protein n=1 Tax=Ostreobium quekettii TaxID=121088 RepID=A0A8S1J2J9_9CHLO|nr:unnamed protein product [Ostreobium quekettii]|eukprot:evm.model.scf_285EXC.4 EVM.evm.TU.scf_285EXC.4   scf_285EXC:33024-33677(-)
MNPVALGRRPVFGPRALRPLSVSNSPSAQRGSSSAALVGGRRILRIGAQRVDEKTAQSAETDSEDAASVSATPEVGSADDATKKWGLEFGIFKAMTSKDGTKKGRAEQAKELLKKYGSAYLITSISFAIISFALCYALVSAGVDVAALLAKVGISASGTNETVGTVAIAYAAHKAASPIRFPPTVALTPIVAEWIGKKVDNSAGGDGLDESGDSGSG